MSKANVAINDAADASLAENLLGSKTESPSQSKFSSPAMGRSSSNSSLSSTPSVTPRGDGRN